MNAAIIISTYPDKSSALKAANELVSARLAACVNISEISSVYSWDGKIENSSECLAVFKTTTKTKESLKKRIEESHPYTVPEVVEIDVLSVNKPYMQWLLNTSL